MEDLPRPIPPHDAHVHTVRSDGAGTVTEMVRAAGGGRADAIGIADHADTRTTDLEQRVREVEAATGSVVAIVPGVELTILDDRGRLALPGGTAPAWFRRVGDGDRTATAVPADRTRLMEHIFAAYHARSWKPPRECARQPASTSAASPRR